MAASMMAFEEMRCFGQIFRVAPSECTSLKADLQLLSRSCSHERKVLASIAPKCTQLPGLKKVSAAYLSSRRVLLANMLEANGKRPIDRRLSPHQLIEASKIYNILTQLSEPVQVHKIPKLAGSGVRVICDFGPVARGAQRMIQKLLRATTPPVSFQYTSQGVPNAIEAALRLIQQEGLYHVGEIDIVNHYPSFTEDAVLSSMPQLTARAIKQIVFAKSAKFEEPKGIFVQYNHQPHTSTPLGIPQGSASSTAVAEWSVSMLKASGITEAAIVNYADNFWLFTSSAASLDAALDALRSRIAGLPGGVFNSAEKQRTTVFDGFRMLGCKIRFNHDVIDVFPTEANLESLESQFRLDVQTVQALLSAETKNLVAPLRLQGVQLYLRLRHRVESWFAAFRFCPEAKVVRDDLFFRLYGVANRYGISSVEAKAATDHSVFKVHSPYDAHAAD